MKTEQEKLLSRIAALYVEQEGAALRRELEEIGRSGFPHPTENLDKKVRRSVFRLKYKAHIRAASLVAACLALALLLPQIVGRMGTGGNVALQQRAEGSVAGSAPSIAAYDAAPEQASAEIGGAPEAPEQAPVDTIDEQAAAQTENTGGPPTGGGELLTGGAGEGLIPLSFALPPGFSRTSAELDNGKSVYRLQNQDLDDVVLTMQYLEEPPDFEGLERMGLEGGEVYYKYLPDYSLVTFEKDGVLYELTCKYELDTLIVLGNAIL